MMGNAEEGTDPVRRGTGMFLRAGDSCPEQEVLMGMSQRTGNVAAPGPTCPQARRYGHP